MGGSHSRECLRGPLERMDAMAKPAENGTLTVVEEPYGGSTVEERKQAMLEGLTPEEIAERNAIPTAAPNGEPHRVIVPELYSENDTFTAYCPAQPNDPGPAAALPLKPGVLAEAQKITDRIGVKVQPESPEYWGLASVMTDEEATLTAHMKVRHPLTFAQLQERSGLEAGKLQQLLDSLALKGVIEYNWENLDGANPAHEKRYVLPMFVPGSAEFTVMNQAQMEEHPELATFFERMSFLPLTKVTKMVPPGGAGIGMHVIPVQRAIESHSEAADVERISHWLKKYDRFAAGSCSCRTAERVRGANDGSDPQNWCIAIGDMADYLVETGKGHFITLDEVLGILLLAEKNGYVHQITNIDGQDKIFAICNCDVNVCYALRTSQLFNTPNMSRSAYTAEVDGAACVACGSWGRNCPPRAAPSAIHDSRCPRFPGARRTGTPITRTTTASNAMKPAPPPAKWPVRRTSRCRATCAWPPKGAIATRWPSSRRRTPSQRCAAACAIAVARPPAPAAPWTRRWPSTR